MISNANTSLRLIKTREANHLVSGKTPPSFCEYQDMLVEAYLQSRRRKSYAASSLIGIKFNLKEAFDFYGKPLWEIRSSDIEFYIDAMLNSNLATPTRRQRIGTIRRFFEWTINNYGKEINELYNTRLIQPVTEDCTLVHNWDDLTARTPPPPRDMINSFFQFMRDYIDRSPKPHITARDYTIYRLQYMLGLRIDEATMLDVNDVRFDLGEFGKLHVRFGKAANTSGKRQRIIPLIADADKLLLWYLTEVRPKLDPSNNSRALFPSSRTPRLKGTTASEYLPKYLCLAGIPEDLIWGTHKFRHACATYNYEDGMSLVTIQLLLGHEDIRTTMIYVHPSSTFIENGYKSTIKSLTNKYINIKKGDS